MRSFWSLLFLAGSAASLTCTTGLLTLFRNCGGRDDYDDTFVDDGALDSFTPSPNDDGTEYVACLAATNAADGGCTFVNGRGFGATSYINGSNTVFVFSNYRKGGYYETFRLETSDALDYCSAWLEATAYLWQPEGPLIYLNCTACTTDLCNDPMTMATAAYQTGTTSAAGNGYWPLNLLALGTALISVTILQ